MDPARWAQIEELYLEADALEPSARADFLREACADDPELQSEVRSLLDTESAADTFLDLGIDALALLLEDAAGNQEDEDEPTPSHIGPYRIAGLLGRGGMGLVYLAQDLKHDRKVALKVLRPDLAATLASERFLQEIRIAANLTHPHILPVYDSGESSGVLYYVMPFIDGESLRDRLDREHELPIADAVSILRDVVDGLSYSHGMGVVHRDIKPANILLSGRHAMVADFGVAKAVTEAAGHHQLTTTGVALGTPSYMSPEQAAADPVDHRTDLYAVGAVAYELLTGRPPFTGTTAPAILSAHMTQTPEPVTDHRDGVPQDLANLVMRCLEKKPADRWQTAEQMLDHVGKLAATPSGGVTPTATRPVGDGQPWRRLADRLPAAALVVVLAVAAIVAIRSAGADAVELGPTTRITREAELEIDPALSPDGSMLAYASGVPGQFSIMVRQVDGGRPIPLSDTDGGDQRRPKWSPDRTRILYQSVRAGEGSSIYWAPALGGVATLIAPPPATNPAWSPDGDSIAYVSGSALTVKAVAGGEARTVADGLVDPHSPAWSSQGLVAYVEGESGDDAGQGGQGAVGNLGPTELWVVPSRGGDAIRVTDGGSQEMSPVWGPDGRFLWFVSDRLGANDVWRMPIARSGEAGGVAEQVTNGLQIQAISLAVGKLAYADASFRSNIWSYDLELSEASRSPVTGGNQRIENFSVSRDGQWVAFDSDRGGNQDIYKQRVSGGDPQPLTAHAADDFAPAWSPDGEQVAFHSLRNGTRDIFVISKDGGTPVAVAEGPDELSLPSWSTDGNELAYSSTRGGSREIHVMSRSSDRSSWEPPALLATGVVPGWADWSPDGERIGYLSGRRIVIVPAAGGDAVSLASLDDEPLTMEWSGDGRSMLVQTGSYGGLSSIWSIPLDGSARTLLRTFDDPLRPLGRFHQAGDRVFATVTEMESDILVVEVVKGGG